MSIDCRPPLLGRLRTRHWVAVDFLMVVTLAVAAHAQGWHDTASGAPAWLAVTAGLGAVLPLAVRRIWPLPVCAVVLLCACGSMLVSGAQYPAFETALAIYPVTAGRSARSMAVVLLAALGMLSAAAWFAPPLETTGSLVGLMVTSAVLVTVAAVLGATVRAHRLFQIRLREMTMREAMTRQQLSIARELHDAVAHRMSVIALQAGVANFVVDDRPEEAQRVLSSIEETSRTGLRELRSLLGLLRAGSQALEPGDHCRPGIADLDALILPFRAAGLQVPLVVAGVARPLPPDADTSAYRIVQEALTNVVRHAGATRAEVLVDYTADAVEVRVTDNGSGSAPAGPQTGPPAGHGIPGMRERVGLLGGELSVGPLPLPGGGFQVRARLPLDAVPV